MKPKLIAPCGMNCNLCKGYLKGNCPGCRGDDKDKPNYCVNCKMVVCGFKYCFECDKYPCRRMKDLDKRYKIKYGMSMIDNLEFIKTQGIRAFLRNEKKRWIKDKKVFCVHDKKYY